MGIPKFFGRVIVPHHAAALLEQLPPIDHLHIDCNAVFHEEAAVTFVYGDFRTQLEKRGPPGKAEIERLDAEIKNMTDDQLRYRLKQNIARRITLLVRQVNTNNTLKSLYVSVDALAPLAKINQQRYRRQKAAMDRAAALADAAHPPPPGFARFDASSQFTPGTELMQELNVFLRQFFHDRRHTFPPLIVYTSHFGTGEGEHVLLAYIRKDIPPNESIAVVGADADLIMLGLRLPHPFYIIRKDLKPEFRRDRTTGRVEPVKKIIDVGEFRKQLTTAGIGLNEYFFALTCLYGNDFIPAQPGLDDVELSYPRIHQALQNTKFFTPQGFSILAWGAFLKGLVEFQTQCLATIAQRQLQYPFAMAQASLGPGGVLDINKFRGYWYQRVFNLPPVTYTTDQIGAAVTGLVKQHFTMLLWVNQYYTDHQSVDWNLAYSRQFAPLLWDAARASEHNPISPQPYLLNPIGQLLAVIPKAARHLVPPEAQAAYEPSSPIYDFYPHRVTVIIEGRTAGEAHMGIPWMPLIDINRLLDVQNRIQITNTRLQAFAPEAPWVDRAAPEAKYFIAPSMPRLPAPNPTPAPVPKVETNPPFATDANIRLLSELYGYDLVREMFPRTRRFYPDVIQPAIVALEIFPVVQPLRRDRNTVLLPPEPISTPTPTPPLTAEDVEEYEATTPI